MNLTLKNIKLTVSYDGTDFHGFQRQDGPRTVQGELDAAIRRLTGEDIAVVGASRTDAGVHALGQTVSFRTASTIPPDRFHLALAPELPADLAAVGACEVPDGFHARHSARAKEYRYVTYHAPRPLPFLRRGAYHLEKPLDLESIRQAAAGLLGKHDFTVFGNTGSSPSDPNKTLHEIEIIEHEIFVIFRIHGDSFLYKMVRNLVGGLIAVGAHRLEPAALAAALQTGRRPAAVVTLPPHGLYLIRVDYPD